MITINTDMSGIELQPSNQISWTPITLTRTTNTVTRTTNLQPTYLTSSYLQDIEDMKERLKNQEKILTMTESRKKCISVRAVKALRCPGCDAPLKFDKDIYEGTVPKTKCEYCGILVAFEEE